MLWAGYGPGLQFSDRVYKSRGRPVYAHVLNTKFYSFLLKTMTISPLHTTFSRAWRNALQACLVARKTSMQAGEWEFGPFGYLSGMEKVARMKLKAVQRLAPDERQIRCFCRANLIACREGGGTQCRARASEEMAWVCAYPQKSGVRNLVIALFTLLRLTAKTHATIPPLPLRTLRSEKILHRRAGKRRHLL